MRLDVRTLIAVGALAGLGVAALADWWEVRWADGVTPAGSAGIPGTAGSGGLAAILPAVVLAAMLATLTLGRGGRRVVGLVALGAGLGMAWLGIAGPLPTPAVVEQHVALATLGGDWALSVLGAPRAYGVIGLLVAAASALLVARPPAKRAPGVRKASGEVTDPLASWKAMDDGQDPTDDEGVRA